MVRYISLLLFIGLAFWSCEDEQDTTTPTVTITFSTDDSVSEIVTITCISTDNEGVEKVELWVNGVSTGVTDDTEPYSLDWNTTTYEDGSYVITVRSYDTSGNTTDSEPLVLTVDNSLSVPQGVNITSVTYTITEMIVEWEQSSDGDFNNYKVLYSETESGNKDTIQTYTDRTITSHIITDFDPLIENWFWVQVTDTMGLSSIGGGMTNEIDSPPAQVDISWVTYNLEYNSEVMDINWQKSFDDDFFQYTLKVSDDSLFTTEEILFNTDDINENSYIYSRICENVQQVSDGLLPIFFKSITTDFWGQNTESPPYQVTFQYPILNITAPDTIHRPSGAIVSFYLISAELIDSFDNETVSFVGFTSYHVEGDSMMNNGNYIFLYDDGSEVVLFAPDFTSGDATKGDGIYSFRIPIYGTGFTDPSFQTIAGNFIWYFTVQYHCLEIEPFIHNIIVE